MRVELLQEVGPKDNVSAALNLSQSRDPRFCDLDQNHCLVMAAGNVIAAPVDYPDGIIHDEYEKIQTAGRRSIIIG
ncbi:hypothetical protein BDZ91DRAFT_715925 [Kalaharituber pfeilii]|nr:hypothetical protein BDZ91DRAFT_715925 [Kalaharituber pfeilii]